MTNHKYLLPRNLGEYYQQLHQLTKPIGFKSILEFEMELNRLSK